MAIVPVLLIAERTERTVRTVRTVRTERTERTEPTVQKFIFIKMLAFT